MRYSHSENVSGDSQARTKLIIIGAALACIIASGLTAVILASNATTSHHNPTERTLEQQSERGTGSPRHGNKP